MTITTKIANHRTFYDASLRIECSEQGNRISWYGYDDSNLKTVMTRTTRGCGRISKTVGNPWKRISKQAAIEVLAEYGITLEQFLAYCNKEPELMKELDEQRAEEERAELLNFFESMPLTSIDALQVATNAEIELADNTPEFKAEEQADDVQDSTNVEIKDKHGDEQFKFPTVEELNQQAKHTEQNSEEAVNFPVSTIKSFEIGKKYLHTTFAPGGFKAEMIFKVIERKKVYLTVTRSYDRGRTYASYTERYKIFCDSNGEYIRPETENTSRYYRPKLYATDIVNTETTTVTTGNDVQGNAIEEPNVDDYTVSTAAQDVATNAEIELADNTPEFKAEEQADDVQDSTNVEIKDSGANTNAYVLDGEDPAPTFITVSQKRLFSGYPVVKFDGKRVSMKKAVKDIRSYFGRVPFKVKNQHGDIFTITKHIGILRLSEALSVIEQELRKCAEYQYPLATIEKIRKHFLKLQDAQDETITYAATEPNIDDYAVTVEAQDAAIDAEIENAKSNLRKIVDVQDTPTDNFTAQLAALKAERDAAEAVYKEKEAAVQKAQAEMCATCDVYEDAKNAITQLYEEKAAELTATISYLSDMKLIRQDGTDTYGGSTLEVIAHYDDNFNDCFIFTVEGLWHAGHCGIYYTPEQVTAVINQFQYACRNDEDKFKFPTVEELILPEPELKRLPPAAEIFAELEPDDNPDTFIGRYITSVWVKVPDAISSGIAIRSTDFARAERALHMLQKASQGCTIISEPKIEFQTPDNELIRIYHAAETDGSEDDPDTDDELLDSPELMPTLKGGDDKVNDLTTDNSLARALRTAFPKLNRDIETRDKLIFGEYNPTTYLCGLRYFDGLTVGTLETLVLNTFISPAERQNESPTTAQILDFMERYPDYTAHGYAVSIGRDDYRITLEGVTKGAPADTGEELDAFTILFKYADEIDTTIMHCWYD